MDQNRRFLVEEISAMMMFCEESHIRVSTPRGRMSRRRRETDLKEEETGHTEDVDGVTDGVGVDAVG